MQLRDFPTPADTSVEWRVLTRRTNSAAQRQARQRYAAANRDLARFGLAETDATPQGRDTGRSSRLVDGWWILWGAVLGAAMWIGFFWWVL